MGARKGKMAAGTASFFNGDSAFIAYNRAVSNRRQQKTNKQIAAEISVR